MDIDDLINRIVSIALVLMLILVLTAAGFVMVAALGCVAGASSSDICR